MLTALLDRLATLGVQVCWARNLSMPGVWLARERLLILDATDATDGLSLAIADVLDEIDPHPNVA